LLKINIYLASKYTVMQGMYTKAFKAVWIIYSVCGLLLLTTAVFIPPHFVLEHTPTCYSVKQWGRECFMCGATRSFIQAGGGNFNEALQFNKLAFVLFILIIINTIALIYYTITTKKTKS
jgi:hypothetical protein